MIDKWVSDIEFQFQYSTVYEFRSDCTGITLQLTDDYKVRNNILGKLQHNAKPFLNSHLVWLTLSSRHFSFILLSSFSPLFSSCPPQKYLTATQQLIVPDDMAMYKRFVGARS
jgi:phosphatidylinositol 4-kinase A